MKKEPVAKNEGRDKKTRASRCLLSSAPYGEETTWVIGHRSPDSDAVGSAIACAYLLNELGIRAEAAVSGPLNSETRFALNSFGVDSPPVISNAEGKQFFLVDHSSYSQAVKGMKKARILGVLDHHGFGDIQTSQPIYVRSAAVGATATLVWLMFVETGIGIPQDIARVLLMALLSDTRNMMRNVSGADREAFAALVPLARIGDTDAFYKKMERSLADYGNMTGRDIFLSDYKEYEAGGKRFGIAVVRADTTERIGELKPQMAEAMKEYFPESGQDMLYTIFHDRSDNRTHSLVLLCEGEGAEELLRKTFPCEDGKNCILIRENLSRKTDIVPALSRKLKDHAK
jgi:manganese-dependent inorganic pyrophosphatase